MSEPSFTMRAEVRDATGATTWRGDVPAYPTTDDACASYELDLTVIPALADGDTIHLVQEHTVRHAD